MRQVLILRISETVQMAKISASLGDSTRDISLGIAAPLSGHAPIIGGA
jgi:hypothetical protein